jgi:hypothetical protein
MHHYPGVPWRDWKDAMPYELVMACIHLIDSASGDEEE